MATARVALANLLVPASPEESVGLAGQAIAQAGAVGVDVICFPECYLPGYRGLGMQVPPPDAAFLARAWSAVAAAAKTANVAVVIGTERVVPGGLMISALVVNRDGSIAGFQDKVQLDPSEEDGAYKVRGIGRRVFHAGPLTFGVAICHEGFRYPETVRWAVQHGAQLVFHPHFHVSGPDDYQPTTYADPANTFHEKAALCRAAENTCFYATVNCASPRSQTTSAFVRPDGTLISYQPYGKPGLLIEDLDLSEATGLIAARSRSSESPRERQRREAAALAAGSGGRSS